MSIFRVSKLELSNFKGFGASRTTPIEINLDADLVLVMGPNGRGKTSIVEALELVATGGIERRVGAPNEFSMRDFIHRSAHNADNKAEATVSVTWNGESTKDEVTIQHANRGVVSPDPSGPLSQARARDWSATGRMNLLRTTAFLYSDALGAMLGVDLDARKQILESYLPEGTRLRELTSASTPRGEVMQFRDRIAQIQDAVARTKQREVDTARAVEKTATKIASVPVTLTKSGGRTLVVPTSLRRGLDQINGLVGGSSAITNENPETIRKLASDALSMAEQLQQQVEETARSEAPADAERPVILERLRQLEKALGSPDVPGPAALARRHDELGSEANLIAQLAEIERRVAQIRSEQALLWSNDGGSALLDGIGRSPAGTLPLLANLARFRAEDPRPAWWTEAGLPPPNPDQFSKLLARELTRWRDLKAQTDSAEAERAKVSDLLDARRRIDVTAPLLEELQKSWNRHSAGQVLPTRGDGALDKASLLSALESSQTAVPATRPEEEKPAQFRELARVLGDWAGARQQAKDAEDESQTEQAKVRTKTVTALEALAVCLGSLSQKRGGDLSTRMRARAVEARYGKQMDEAMRRVLFGYAHPEHLVENAHARFTDKGHFVVGIKDGDAQTGIASLSRSQLTSVAFSLALAANLGLPDPLLGFVCLDDVSDAFDLDNLAADASILRMLAYGGNGRSSRQLILTNHNDELTDRIVPLLLPPGKRTMRVVQLVGGGVDSDVEIKQWRVQGEHHQGSEAESPMRRFYP